MSSRKTTSKLVNEINSLIPHLFANPAKKKKNKKKKSQVLVRSNPTRSVGVPLAVGSIARNLASTRFGSHTIKVPFKACQNSIVCGNSIAAGGNTFISPSTTMPGWDIQPTNGNLLGFAVANIASSFMQFRLNRLVVTFIPLLPTTAQGIVALGYTADPYDITPTFSSVNSIECSVQTNIWNRASLNCTPFLDRTWKYNNLTDVTAPTLRQCQAGSVTGFLVGGPALSASASIGLLELEGEFEFLGMGAESLIGLTYRDHRTLPEKSDLPPVPPEVPFDSRMIYPPEIPNQMVLPSNPHRPEDYEYVRRPPLVRVDTPAYSTLKQL